MEFTGKIVFDASPALLNTANRLVDAIAGKSVEPQKGIEMAPLELVLPDPVSAPKPATSSTPDPAVPDDNAQVAPDPVPPMQPRGTSQKVTLEQLRAIISEKAKAGKRKEVKEIITALGSDSATNMNPDNYAEAFEKISAL